MRRIWILGLLAFGALHAEYYQPILDLEVGIGYRHDNYKMDIEAFKHNPVTNFREATKEKWRMTWHEIEIVESSANFRYTTCLNYHLRLTADWGRIHSGEGHIDGFAKLPGHVRKDQIDSDSSSSSGSDERDHFQHFSRIKGKVNRGYVMDFEGAVGYQFTSNGRRVIVTPLVGWSYHYQRLEFHHGEQDIDTFDPFPVHGDIPDLHFLYRPRWYGPWIGADVEAQVDIPCVIFFGTIEYHWAQFRADGDWNFADAFINKFNDHSNGHGIIVSGGVSHKLECNLWITAFGIWRNWQAGRGRHKTIKHVNRLLHHTQTFGTFPVFAPHKDQDMEKFRWNSWVAGLAFEYRF